MSKLDEYQMKVVNETGHCLVIAGPGSGKSTTICEKVKTLIANGTNESEILLISFTNKSVDDLKKKLGNKIPSFVISISLRIVVLFLLF